MTHDINAPSRPVRNDLLSYIVVRAVILFLTIAQPLVCASQQPTAKTATPPPSSGWQRVESIPLGTSIKLKARTGDMNCTLAAVDDNSLTCSHHKSTTFARVDILSIVIPHRGRSALILGGIGAGAGVATVKILATAAFDGFFNGHAKHAVYAGGAGLGVLVFAPIGFATDFTHSTVYKAP